MITTSPTPATMVPAATATQIDAVNRPHAHPGTPPSRRAPSRAARGAPADPLAHRRAAARKLYLAALDSWLTARTDEEQDQARRVLDEALDLMGVAAPGERRCTRSASAAAPRRAWAARP